MVKKKDDLGPIAIIGGIIGGLALFIFGAGQKKEGGGGCGCGK